MKEGFIVLKVTKTGWKQVSGSSVYPSYKIAQDIMVNWAVYHAAPGNYFAVAKIVQIVKS